MTDKLIMQVEELAALLLEREYKICTVESCTGGLLSQSITEISGSSSWFEYGFVTYSNQAKTELVNVSESTLKQFGAVSQQVVEEMALGALNVSGANLALSVSGIAGPNGGSTEKPVGTVCIGIAMTTKENTYQPLVVSNKYHFKGDRAKIRQEASMAAFSCALERLQKIS